MEIATEASEEDISPSTLLWWRTRQNYVSAAMQAGAHKTTSSVFKSVVMQAVHMHPKVMWWVNGFEGSSDRDSPQT